MRLLASFVMRGRSQAVMAAVVLAMVSLLLPPISILSSATIALVTLRRGHVYGLAVAGLAAAAGALLALLVFSNPAPAIAFVLMLWLPALLAAVVLRDTRSLALMVESVLLVGLLVIAVVYMQVPDPTATWQRGLEPLSKEFVAAGFLDENSRILFVEALSRWMTGLMAAGFFLQLVSSVFLARWWQALLYNPGGFREEFHALRLHRVLGFIGLGLLALLFSGVSGKQGFLFDLSLLLVAAFVLQGLAVTHAVVAGKQFHSAWLIGLYMLWLLITPQFTVALAALGFTDIWIDFRARLSNPGGPTND